MGRELGLGIDLCLPFMQKSFKVNAYGSIKALSTRLMSRADVGTPAYRCIITSLTCTWEGDAKVQRLHMRVDTLNKESGKQQCWVVHCLWNLSFLWVQICWWGWASSFPDGDRRFFTACITKHTEEAEDVNSRMAGRFEPTAPTSYGTLCWGEVTQDAGSRAGLNKKEPKNSGQHWTGGRWDFLGKESPGAASQSA